MRFGNFPLRWLLKKSLKNSPLLTTVDGRWNQTLAVVVAPASRNFNVIFGLCVWVRWTEKSNPERRGSYIEFCSTLKFWGVGLCLVHVCRIVGFDFLSIYTVCLCVCFRCRWWPDVLTLSPILPIKQDVWFVEEDHCPIIKSTTWGTYEGR